MVVAVALLFFVFLPFIYVLTIIDAEYGMKEYADRGASYPPRPKARRG